MTWSRDDGGPEVLSYGGDEPPRRPSRQLLGVAAAGLLVGFGAGLLAGDRTDPPATAAKGPEPTDTAHETARVAAGAVRKFGPPVGDELVLSVFNWGDRKVAAEVASLPGWRLRLTRTEPASVAPRSWGQLRFSAPVTRCGSYPGDIRVVVLRIATDRGAETQVVPLAESAHAVLQERYDAACSSRQP
jgi:hypothetical protein